jgi:DNA-binding NtrC family response regulator
VSASTPTESPPLTGTVLVVDDDPFIRGIYSKTLGQVGHEVLEAPDAAAVRALLASAECPALDAVVLDVMMPGESGLELLMWLRAQRPQLPIILATASDSAKDAVMALKAGAFDYLIKPVRYAELQLVVRNAVERSQMARELTMRRSLDEPRARGTGGAVFVSEPMRRIMATLDMVKDANVPVMLLGQTGTGKEVVARTLHDRSARAGRAFVPVNCAALPRELADSELFGHEKGAFTGAAGRRVGRFEEAQGGTLFLDEVAELDPAIQAKLLRVLQESELTRVGGAGSVRLDVRLVVATHRDLRAMVKQGQFREDLFYRLNVIVLKLPPLGERCEEIPYLADVLLRRFADQERMEPRVLSDEAVAALRAHTWPGNVRELDNTLKRSVLLTRNRVLLGVDIRWEPGLTPPMGVPVLEPLPPVTAPQAAPVEPPSVLPPTASAPALEPPDLTAPTPAHSAPAQAAPAQTQTPEDLPGLEGGVRPLHELEPVLMMRALAETKGNVTEAARLMGIGRATFYRWAQRYKLPL